jgi:hypothetical protein
MPEEKNPGGYEDRDRDTEGEGESGAFLKLEYINKSSVTVTV